MLLEAPAHLVLRVIGSPSSGCPLGSPRDSARGVAKPAQVPGTCF